MLFLLAPYIGRTIRTPAAAMNIFAQQYQMHRLAADILSMPVGVNDLGWVSFRNDNYVLDFWGLGSEVARKARMASFGDKSGWISELAQSRGIKVAMIYEVWVTPPPDWIKVGELHLNMAKLTSAQGIVSIFVLDRQVLPEVVRGLERLQGGLPPEASLKLLTMQ